MNKKKVTMGIVVGFIIMLTYAVYLYSPYKYSTTKSPFNNAEINIIILNKPLPFSYNTSPQNSYYEIRYKGRVIDKLLRSECCYTNEIVNIEWSRDNLKFNYINKLEPERIDTSRKEYHFQ